MKVNINNPSPSLLSILSNPNHIITLDANFLISPDRSKYCGRSFEFSRFKNIWLDPIFSAFPKLAIHEAVSEELILEPIQEYVKVLLDNIPPGILIHKDSTLTTVESVLRDTIENKIYPHTNYDPMIDNKDDRGEVKSLAFIAVKGLIYFAAHDNNALQLIEKSYEWSTGLDNIQAIQMYELIYYLYIKDLGDNKSLRMLYKYQYHLTNFEKKTNPSWGDFIFKMDKLYKSHIQ